MRHSSQNRRPWYLREPLPEAAVFSCRRCHIVISKPLVALRDRSQLSERVQTSRVPEGYYYSIPEAEEFEYHVAVPLKALMTHVQYDLSKLTGCCGPSGNDGPNHLCKCDRAIGTERSDCLWPAAVYLSLAKVQGFSLVE